MCEIKSPFSISSESTGLDLLVFQPLAERNLPHGFSFRLRRLDGVESSQPFGLPGGTVANRIELAHTLGLRDTVHMQQVHGKELEVLTEPPETPPTCDGLISRAAGLGLVVQTADCVPILMWDADRNVVAAVHAGWRGTLARIPHEAVRLLQTRFATTPGSLHAVMGPAVGRCCYEVGDEVVRSFDRRFTFAETLFSPGIRGRKHLDLIEANRRILVESGVPEAQVHAANLCTSCCSQLLYSYRREGKSVGRLYGIIGVASR